MRVMVGRDRLKYVTDRRSQADSDRLMALTVETMRNCPVE
jgi:hypothetical protein